MPPMREILHRVFHWTRPHPRIGIEVSSYWLVDERAVIDPLVPAEGLEAFEEEPPRHVLLTNRHHYRDAARFAERFDARVGCAKSGLNELGPDHGVEGFEPGDIVARGGIALEIGVICPDETALWFPPLDGRQALVAVGDGVVREGDGPLGFVPDELLGDEPERVKAGLKEAYARLLDREFGHLLLAHGHPCIGEGKEALRAFVES